MSVTFLGLPNIARRGPCVISTVGPEPTTGEAMNLKTEDLSESSRILSVYPPLSRWSVNMFTDYFDFDGIALLKNNLTDNGYFRISTNQSFVGMAPSAIIASSNITGVVGDVTEFPSTPDASYITPTVTTNTWSVSFSFPSIAGPVTALQSEAGAHFVVVMLLVGTPMNAHPTVGVELRENGNLVRALGKKAVTNVGTDQFFVWAFNPAELVIPTSMANVEVKITGYKGDNGSYCKLNTVELNYESAQDSALAALDSLWISANQGHFFSQRDGISPTKSNHYNRFSSVTNLDAFNVLILDDGAELNPPAAVQYSLPDSALVAGMTLTPGGYVEAGCMIFGSKIEVDPGTTTDSGQPKSQVDTTSTGTSTEGYGVNSFTRRGLNSSMELICSRDTQMKLLGRIGWQKGHSGLFYCILEPDVDAKYQIFSSFGCILTEIQSYPVDIGRTGGTDRSQDAFIVVIGLEEKI